MTEISDERGSLPAAVERFVLHWGDLGGQWGVNRSVAQIHALLYLSERPLTADEIAAALGIARSNVSTSLRELLGWSLVRRVPMRNERREHFAAETDLWEMLARIAAGRKEREVDPAIATLRLCVAEADGDAAVDAVARRRLRAMLDFTETMERGYREMLRVPRPTLARLIRLGGRVVKVLPAGRPGRMPGRGEP